MKIVDYDVICSDDPVCKGFLDRIREAIKCGWQPFGAPILEHDYRAQAMVKYENKYENERAKFIENNKKEMDAVNREIKEILKKTLKCVK